LTSQEDSAERVVPVDVLVVGNGPSALCAAAALSGWWPYYRPEPPHPDPVWHRRLSRQRSLLGADWEFLAHGLTGRSANPVSLLFDRLLHPDPDNLGARFPSRVILRRRGPRVAYRVIGAGPLGGSWNRMPARMLTLSPGWWMELPPSERLEQDLGPGRLTAAEVAQSLQRFAAAHDLQENCLDARVVRLSARPKGGFKALFSRPGSPDPEVAVARRVVLASGVGDLPLRLGIPGEDRPFVFHRAAGLPPAKRRLVVGGGLSAAELALWSLAEGASTLHVFRSGATLAGYATESQYYPDYATAARLMTGATKHPLYHGRRAELTAILPDGTCHLSDGSAYQVDQVVVLIGTLPDLTFLPGEWQRQLKISPWTFETGVEGLYALGPLAGDNFVRFVIGGAWAALRSMLKGSAGTSPPSGPTGRSTPPRA